MAILSTILVGLVVGAIAKLLMPGKDPGGIIVTILLGIAGAFIATYLGQAIGWYKAGQPADWIMSIVGAMILLLLMLVSLGISSGCAAHLRSLAGFGARRDRTARYLRS